MQRDICFVKNLRLRSQGKLMANTPSQRDRALHEVLKGPGLGWSSKAQIQQGAGRNIICATLAEERCRFSVGVPISPLITTYQTLEAENAIALELLQSKCAASPAGLTVGFDGD